MPSPSLQCFALTGFGEVETGMDLSELLITAINEAELRPQSSDIVAIAQKIASKAEGRFCELDTVTPSREAQQLAAKVDKDPRLVELILRDSQAILASRPGLVIAQHRLGHITANAGIDRSNVPGAEELERVLLLPENPDACCAEIRARLNRHFDVEIGCVMTDTLGRPWRNGVVGFAIGAAGVPALRDQRGRQDRQGRELKVTQLGFADEVAAAASLLMGQADESCPAVLIRGLSWSEPACPASALQRDKGSDLFR